jgi:endonuclease/exonuclease/phosphatase (EEP) superfamily protein YafD
VRRVLVDLWDLASIAVPGAGIAAAGGAVAAAVSGSWWLAGGLVLVAVAALVFTWWPRRRMPAPVARDGVRLMAANLWNWNPDMAEAGRSLLVDRPDVVVVSELARDAHDVLAAHFAHHEVLRMGGATGHGVYSHFPLERLPEPQLRGQVLRLRVHAPAPFEMYAAHLPRPTIVAPPSDGSARFAVCRDEIRRLAELVASVPDTVVAGDLNLSDRQPMYRPLMAGRLDAMRTAQAGNTFQAHRAHAYWRLFAMRIDHLVVPADWEVSDARVVRITGSDHRAVCATIAPPPDPDRRGLLAPPEPGGELSAELRAMRDDERF